MPYSPKTWDETDSITPTDLNRIETGVDDVTDDVDTHLAAHLEAWKEIGGSGNPAFGSGWSSYAGTSTAAFRKDVDGVVHLKGVIKHSTGTGTLSSCFTLPKGYRPAASTFLPTTVALTTGMVAGRVTITTGGVVTPDRTGSTEVAWITLDGLSFPTA